MPHDSPAPGTKESTGAGSTRKAIGCTVFPHASRWLLLATLLVATSQTSAQVNIEMLRQEEDVKGVATSLGMDLSLQTGNVELVEFGVRGRVDYVGDAITTFLLSSGDFRWKNGEQFANEAVLHVRQVYLRGSWLQEV